MHIRRGVGVGAGAPEVRPVSHCALPPAPPRPGPIRALQTGKCLLEKQIHEKHIMDLQVTRGAGAGLRMGGCRGINDMHRPKLDLEGGGGVWACGEYLCSSTRHGRGGGRGLAGVVVVGRCVRAGVGAKGCARVQGWEVGRKGGTQYGGVGWSAWKGGSPPDEPCCAALGMLCPLCCRCRPTSRTL